MDATTSRLPVVQQRLADMGVTDVKFFFAPNQPDLSNLKDDAAEVLEHFLDGKVKQLPSFGDATEKKI